MRRRTIEDYAEMVYNIQLTKDTVHTNDIAKALGLSPASVTEIFQKLSKEGYINYKKYSGVTLTKKGMEVALKTKKKHDVLKDFLMLIGVGENIANKDACKIEHNVDKITMEKLTKFVEFSRMENGCSRWIDHFKYFDKTGKFIRCTPKDSKDCPVHSKD